MRRCNKNEVSLAPFVEILHRPRVFSEITKVLYDQTLMQVRKLDEVAILPKNINVQFLRRYKEEIKLRLES